MDKGLDERQDKRDYLNPLSIKHQLIESEHLRPSPEMTPWGREGIDPAPKRLIEG